MPQPVALIAMDMDGTLLLPYDVAVNRISPGCIAALHEARRAGIHLAIASGRMTDDAGFFALDADLPDIHILGVNGTCCLDRPMGTITENHLVSDATARALVALLQARGIDYGVFSPFDLVLSQKDVSPEEVARHWGTYLLREGCRIHVRWNNDGLEQALSAGMNKLLVRCDEGPRVLAPLQKELEERFPDIEVTSSWINNLEINPLGVNKGSALISLASRLGVSMDRVMAIGDNDNDLSMLRVAGWAVAMGNSSPAVLAAASHITRSNAEDGVAAAIRCLALGYDEKGVSKLK